VAIVMLGLERINKKGRINFFILKLIWIKKKIIQVLF